VGRFYVISLMKPPTHDSVYGVYAFGLSAYSDAITNWRWGGVIGLHGTNDPASIGKRMSHGCIRMLNRDIERLAKILPLGTPITIR
jgi:lipoprotein-anchoring transpeptidase ErfK/SrfK